MNNFTHYIESIVNTMPQEGLIYTDTVALDFADAFGIEPMRARKTVNVYLKRLADSNLITRIKKGVYGKNKKTVFGLLVPDITAVTEAIFTRDGTDVIGYETGATLLNRYGLSTLIPKNLMIASNHYRRKVPNGAAVTVTKPITIITTKNAPYLQFISAMQSMQRYSIDAESPQAVLRNVIDKLELDKEQLIKYAYLYCSDKELRHLIGILIGEDIENYDVA